MNYDYSDIRISLNAKEIKRFITQIAKTNSSRLPNIASCKSLLSRRKSWECSIGHNNRQQCLCNTLMP